MAETGQFASKFLSEVEDKTKSQKSTHNLTNKGKESCVLEYSWDSFRASHEEPHVVQVQVSGVLLEINLTLDHHRLYSMTTLITG